MIETYVPKAVEQGKFQGHIKMKLLSFDERMELAELTTSGKLSGIGLIRKMVSDYKDHWSEIALTRVSDGKTYSDLESLKYGNDCHAIIIEVSNWLIGGDEEKEKPSAS